MTACARWWRVLEVAARPARGRGGRPGDRGGDLCSSLTVPPACRLQAWLASRRLLGRRRASGSRPGTGPARHYRAHPARPRRRRRGPAAGEPAWVEVYFAGHAPQHAVLAGGRPGGPRRGGAHRQAGQWTDANATWGYPRRIAELVLLQACRDTSTSTGAIVAACPHCAAPPIARVRRAAPTSPRRCARPGPGRRRPARRQNGCSSRPGPSPADVGSPARRSPGVFLVGMIAHRAWRTARGLQTVVVTSRPAGPLKGLLAGGHGAEPRGARAAGGALRRRSAEGGLAPAGRLASGRGRGAGPSGSRSICAPLEGPRPGRREKGNHQEAPSKLTPPGAPGKADRRYCPCRTRCSPRSPRRGPRRWREAAHSPAPRRCAAGRAAVHLVELLEDLVLHRGRMPTPSSFTSMRTPAPSRCRCRSMQPPPGRESRFSTSAATAWLMRRASTGRAPGRGRLEIGSRARRAVARGHQLGADHRRPRPAPGRWGRAVARRVSIASTRVTRRWALTRSGSRIAVGAPPG
jgi:hypothetical protein